MAVRDPKRPGPRSPKLKPKGAPNPEPVARAPAAPGLGPHGFTPEAPLPSAPEGLGTLALVLEPGTWPVMQLAEHVFRIMADRSLGPRTERIAHLVRLLENEGQARMEKVLRTLEAAKVIDIYPLELWVALAERAPNAWGTPSGSLILNREELMRRTYAIAEPIPLRLPLAAVVKAFALRGGAAPGYDFSPGPPAAYQLSFGGPGVFEILVRADIRGAVVLDAVSVEILDAESEG